MAKISWKKFIENYSGKGHVVSTGTRAKYFKKPTGFSPNNNLPWPSIAEMVKIALGGTFKGDWSHHSYSDTALVSSNGKIKKQSARIEVFVFADPADAAAAAKFLQAVKSVTPQQGFASQIKGTEIDTMQYLEMVRSLGF